MPTHHADRKDNEQPDKRHLEGQSKAGPLPVNEPNEDNDDQLEQDALDAGLRHPNRSEDKPDLDKPAYGGGH